MFESKFDSETDLHITMNLNTCKFISYKNNPGNFILNHILSNLLKSGFSLKNEKTEFLEREQKMRKQKVKLVEMERDKKKKKNIL